MRTEWRTVSSLVAAIDAVSVWSGRAVAWLIPPMLAVVTYDVITRKFFTVREWPFEVSLMIYGAHFMTAAAYCLYMGSHIRTDIFYGRWSPRTQGLVDTAGYLVFYLPGMAVFFWISFDFFMESFLLGERSTWSSWRPIIWPVKMAIPLTAALLFLQGISELVKSYRRARGIAPDGASPAVIET
jgi:TRAP-type mannitol/chloroaromatic compound transport system permease small subunit